MNQPGCIRSIQTSPYKSRIRTFNQNACEAHGEKTNNVDEQHKKTPISLGISTVCSEPTVSAYRKIWTLVTSSSHSEDSDQFDQSLRIDQSLRCPHIERFGP